VGIPRLQIGVGVVLLALARAAVAHAEPTASEKESARDLMEQGRTRLDQRNLKGALEAFTAADSIMHVPTTGFMVASTQAELGLLVEARETLARFLRAAPLPNEPEPFKKARKNAGELDDKLAARIPSLRFEISDATDPVAIVVDDVAVGSTSIKAPLKLNPGHHTVVATAGARTAKAEVDVREADAKTVLLRFTPIAPEPPSPRPVATAEPAKSERRSPWIYLGFGVAAAGVVTGTITGLLMFSKRSDLDDGCTDKQCPPPMHDTYASAHTMATVSTISFVVAGVGAVVGIYGLVRGGSPGSRSAAGSATPWLLRGAF
jgi:hypothetical protein